MLCCVHVRLRGQSRPGLRPRAWPRRRISVTVTLTFKQQCRSRSWTTVSASVLSHICRVKVSTVWQSSYNSCLYLQTVFDLIIIFSIKLLDKIKISLYLFFSDIFLGYIFFHLHNLCPLSKILLCN